MNLSTNVKLRWLEALFQKCERNGFKHNTLDYLSVLKGKEYQWYAVVTRDPRIVQSLNYRYICVKRTHRYNVVRDGLQQSCYTVGQLIIIG